MLLAHSQIYFDACYSKRFSPSFRRARLHSFVSLTACSDRSVCFSLSVFAYISTKWRVSVVVVLTPEHHLTREFCYATLVDLHSAKHNCVFLRQFVFYNDIQTTRRDDVFLWHLRRASHLLVDKSKKISAERLRKRLAYRYSLWSNCRTMSSLNCSSSITINRNARQAPEQIEN